MTGIVRNAAYQTVEEPLESGDRLLVFTDGLFEQFNEKEDVFGEDRLRREIEEGKNLAVEDLMYRILTSVDAFIGGKNKISLHDDVTLIGIQVL